jgi:Protein of unknown function (DUF3052)
MGNEARCTVRYGDRVSEGRALLETDEVRFRGEFGLAIPRGEIGSVSADGGRLTLRFGNETAIFELGDRAVRWADRIRNPRTLLDKLGVKPDSRLCVMGVDDEAFHALLRDRGLNATASPAPGSDLIVFQANSVADLRRLAELTESLNPNGAIWVVAPKGGRGPREAHVLEAGKRAGLVDTKVARFSDTHTAHKFVIPVAVR